MPQIEDFTIHDPDGFLNSDLENPASASGLIDLVLNLAPHFGVTEGALWPTERVIAVTQALGFNCDARYLARRIDAGDVAPLESSDGFEWTPLQIGGLLQLLHEKRRWLPGFFMRDKNAVEIARDECRAADAAAMVEHLTTLSFETLADRIKQARDPRFRKLFYMAVRLKKLAILENLPPQQLPEVADPQRANEPAGA